MELLKAGVRRVEKKFGDLASLSALYYERFFSMERTTIRIKASNVLSACYWQLKYAKACIVQ